MENLQRDGDLGMVFGKYSDHPGVRAVSNIVWTFIELVTEIGHLRGEIEDLKQTIEQQREKV